MHLKILMIRRYKVLSYRDLHHSTLCMFFVKTSLTGYFVKRSTLFFIILNEHS